MNDHGMPRVRGGDRIGSDLTTNNLPNPSVPEGLSGFCSRCQARPGEPCKDRAGKERPDHAARSRPPTQPKSSTKTDWDPLIAEAQRILPSEPLPFVIGALMVMKGTGEKPTAENVRARLWAQGKTKEQLEREAA